MKLNEQQIAELKDFLAQVDPEIDKLANFIHEAGDEEASNTSRYVILKILEKGHSSARSLIQGRDKPAYQLELSDSNEETRIVHDQYWFNVILARMVLRQHLMGGIITETKTMNDIQPLTMYNDGGNKAILGIVDLGYNQQLYFRNRNNKELVKSISISTRNRVDQNKLKNDLAQGKVLPFKPIYRP